MSWSKYHAYYLTKKSKIDVDVAVMVFLSELFICIAEASSLSTSWISIVYGKVTDDSYSLVYRNKDTLERMSVIVKNYGQFSSGKVEIKLDVDLDGLFAETSEFFSPFGDEIFINFLEHSLNVEED